MILKFNQLSVGDVFKFSGIEHCIKKSARTAYINKEKHYGFTLAKMKFVN